ncbi:MAG: hypothetical protein RIS94_693 [Pseudomonadota bacterium]|jgi:ribosomal-protein-alanine N-acetyltransferase
MAARPTRVCPAFLPEARAMIPPLDDIDRIMSVMERAFPPKYGEAWNRRQVADSLLLTGTHYGLIGPSGESEFGPSDDAAGFFLSRGILDEEELLLFAIHPDHRRKGLAHRLLARFIDDAKQRGARRLFLEMRAGNPAGHLYVSHGFAPVGVRPRYYRTTDGDRLDAISHQLLVE